MRKRDGWLIAVVLVALLLAACGPQMATPTPGAKPSATSEGAQAAPTENAVAAGETPQTAGPSTDSALVNPDDWHVLGEADAAVTIIEYSDFQ
jgi:protein-disulfide isomerase